MSRSINLLASLLAGAAVLLAAPDVTLAGIPGLDKIDIPKPKWAEGADEKTKKILAGGTGCLLGGGLGYYAGDKLGKKYAKDKKLSGEQSKDIQKKFELGAAMAGCAVGASIGTKIIQNLSESARKAQEEAWVKAQNQTGSVAWVDPNNGTVRGTSELIEVKAMPDGSQCGTRRDVIETPEGSAEPYQRVCKAADGRWALQTS
jgi:hypothetical protein